MKLFLGFFFVALCCVPSVEGQQTRSSSLGFDGCYEVTSLSWSPPDDRIKLVPPRLELTSNNDIHPLPYNPGDVRWGSWKAKDNKLKMNFGLLGGFRGTLKRSASGEFAGKLKEYCDYRCEWKTRVGSIRIRKVACVR